PLGVLLASLLLRRFSFFPGPRSRGSAPFFRGVKLEKIRVPKAGQERQDDAKTEQVDEHDQERGQEGGAVGPRCCRRRGCGECRFGLFHRRPFWFQESGVSPGHYHFYGHPCQTARLPAYCPLGRALSAFPKHLPRNSWKVLDALP